MAGYPGTLHGAIFGIATRRALSDYLKFVGLIMFILLAVAWTIDLAANFPRIRADAITRDVSVTGIALPYLAFRSADMITRMLPMACFFGVYLAEIMRRFRLESVILQASGASPWRMLCAVLIFSGLLGSLQFKLEDTWRPAAIAAQIELGHGSYASRFRRGWMVGHNWLVNGDVAIRAELLRDDPPAMRDVLVFTGIRSPKLETIYSATRATPGPTPFEWTLYGGSKWQAASGVASSQPFDELTLTLDLIPEQISYYRIPASYVPGAPLQALATMRNAPTAPDADVAIWRRLTAWTLPGTFALLAFFMGNSGFTGRSPKIPKLIAMACFGYVTVVSVKVFWALGELDVLAAPISVLATVGGVLGVSAILLSRQV